MKAPKRIDLDPEKMKKFLQRVKNRKLTNVNYEIIEGMADTITFLSLAVQQKKHPSDVLSGCSLALPQRS